MDCLRERRRRILYELKECYDGHEIPWRFWELVTGCAYHAFKLYFISSSSLSTTTALSKVTQMQLLKTITPHLLSGGFLLTQRFDVVSRSNIDLATGQSFCSWFPDKREQCITYRGPSPPYRGQLIPDCGPWARDQRHLLAGHATLAGVGREAAPHRVPDIRGESGELARAFMHCFPLSSSARHLPLFAFVLWGSTALFGRAISVSWPSSRILLHIGTRVGAQRSAQSLILLGRNASDSMSTWHEAD